MALQPLSLEQLAKVLSETPTPEGLYDILSKYENEACLLFTDTEVTGDAKLLSTFYTSFLISHLVTDQIQEARAATHRMPPTLLKGDQVLQIGILLLRAVWQHKYADIYQILRSTPWPEPINIIVAKYDAYFSEKSFKDISRAYEAIRPEAAAAYLGLDAIAKPDASGRVDSKLIESLTQRGWEWDGEKRLFWPRVPEEPVAFKGSKSNGISQVVGLGSSHGS